MTVICIIEAAIILILAAVIYYFYARNDIAQRANDAIVEAEKSDAKGHDKMMIAVNYVKDKISVVAKKVFTEENIENIIQFAFDSIKDLTKK